ncbi:MAG: galactose mutarotase [Paracoccaceae bacterium]|nr:galactose mutarotase [Paracoccaceae bacterium]
MISVKEIGSIDGFAVKEALLQSDTSSVSILSFGAITKNWFVKAEDSRIPILLGFDSLEAYQSDDNYIGIIAGRVANRTQNGRFKLDNFEYRLPINSYPHHLHGGHSGFGKRNWDFEFDSKNCAVQMTYGSSHLEEGYPGSVDVTVVVSLKGNTLSYEMSAIPDRPTPINLAQHNYYNLMGSGNIWEHSFQSIASSYTPTDKTLIPNGKILSLEMYRTQGQKSNWDLRTPKTFKKLDPEKIGIDINLVLPSDRSLSAPVATVCVKNGMILEIFTDQPGLQFYSGKNLSSAHLGCNGKQYKSFEGFCLEPQKFPSSLTIPSFPSIISTPDNPYKQLTSIKVSAPY